MSNSIIHQPIGGFTTALTDKIFKRTANRRFRRLSKEQLNKLGEVQYHFMKEVSNVQSSRKDGVGYHGYNHRRPYKTIRKGCRIRYRHIEKTWRK